MSKKYTYFFGRGTAEGNAAMASLLGNKGAHVAEMTILGIPVPPGFTISAEACRYFHAHHNRYPEDLPDELNQHLARLEAATKKGFGGPTMPLLVSVRSGASVSMPGMMDTVLNLGLNDETVEALARESGNPRFAYDAYRRFAQMFGNVVLGIPHNDFESLLQEQKEKSKVDEDSALNVSSLRELITAYEQLIKEKSGSDLPQDPGKQLTMAIGAVFNSWNNDRAVTYRKLHQIPDDLGTAVTVQAMVFGNTGERSGTGVAFTRDPATGEKQFYGEYLLNAQGEDVVAGIRTPKPIECLAADMPAVYEQLTAIAQRLENHYRDIQDLEFTIEDGTLYLLQTRTGKRTARAALKIAVDMVREGLITKEEAMMRISPEQLEQFLHPTIDPDERYEPIAKGLPASPGAAVGHAVFDASEAMKAAAAGQPVILVRHETSPDDVGGMAASKGILTSTGGLTSHAAVVGRGMGKCCVVGCGAIEVYEQERYFQANGITVKEGDMITLNGNTGEVIVGEAKLVEPQMTDDFTTFLSWSDEFRTLGVRTNADTPKDCRAAVAFGAEGIGLCRTEHMFFGKERLPLMQEMILADDRRARQHALKKLLPFQRADFYEIFTVMQSRPVTIRLLDPPLHEFLPKTGEEIRSLAQTIGVDRKKIATKIDSLRELNPMLGHRGCRLGLVFPEITRMQVQAIIEAACQAAQEGYEVHPEIMVPLVGHRNELERTKQDIVRIAEETMRKSGVTIPYLVGTMIEVPRAAVTAEEIAQHADFFSFGTNDLTQMMFGFSRDDIGKFLPFYLQEGILSHDPFMSLDQTGVGAVMWMGVEKGRREKPTLKIGICGEHGGDPASIDFCHRLGLDYVSCSPFRVPIARLAAAQAALRHRRSSGA